MSQNPLQEVICTSQNGNDLTDRKLLEIGETVWLAGKPMASEKGTISLRTDNYTLVIKEEDCLETMMVGTNYLTRIRKGTNVIFRLEIVAQVIAHDCNCNGKKQGNEANDTTSVALRPNDAFGGWDKWGDLWRPPTSNCWNVLNWVKVCWSYEDPEKKGVFHVYCHWEPQVERICDPWPRHYY